MAVELGLRDEIGKRTTLNLLIQGAANHAMLNAHNDVSTALDATDPTLRPLYDRFSVLGSLGYWSWESSLVMGRASRFWATIGRHDHPFFGHALLTKHGRALNDCAKTDILRIARERGVSANPLALTVHGNTVTLEMDRREKHYRHRLARIAKLAMVHVWGIKPSRLDAALISFGEKVPSQQLRKRTSRRGRLMGWMMDRTGLEYIQRDGEGLKVFARGFAWPVLVHELVKGTAELVCLHGLAGLDEATYRHVIDAADGPELELWHLQAGHELWRRFEACRPEAAPVSETLMGLARLSPRDLERVMLAVVEDTPFARQLLAGLAAR